MSETGSNGVIVANAPISYGAFELTVGIDPSVPDGVSILDAVQSSGYSGIDLGPVGYLGVGAQLGERLAERGLGLAGAYLEMPYADGEALDLLLPELDAMFDTFDAVAPLVGGPLPRPTLADAGSPLRNGQPGRAVNDRSMGMDEDTWQAFGIGLNRIVARCRDRGYEPTFHHETGTYVEAPWEIERMLELTDMGLCLDTGHFLIGGGDPVQALRDWGARINHVHLKDALLSVMAGIMADGAPTMQIWSREAFPPFGQGDVDCVGVLDELRRMDFSGWLVVEQDILPQTAERFARAASDQIANREFLAAQGF
jgi:inosose dehydratase